MGGVSWVTRVMDQLRDGSRGSWVTKYDPSSALIGGWWWWMGECPTPCKREGELSERWKCPGNMSGGNVPSRRIAATGRRKNGRQNAAGSDAHPATSKTRSQRSYCMPRSAGRIVGHSGPDVSSPSTQSFDALQPTARIKIDPQSLPPGRRPFHPDAGRFHHAVVYLANPLGSIADIKPRFKPARHQPAQ